MKPTTSYYTIFSFFALVNIISIFYLKELSYFFYGFSQDLIESDTVEAYTAYQQSFPFRRFWGVLTTVITLIMAITSYRYWIKTAENKHQLYFLYRYTVGLIFIISAILSLVYLFVILVALPTRII